MIKRLLALLFLAGGVALATTTSRLGLDLIDDGTTPWGEAVRDNYDLIDVGVGVLNSTQTFTGGVTFTSATVTSLRSTQVIVGTPTYSGSEKLIVNGNAKFFGPSGAVVSLCDQNGLNCANLSSGTINGAVSTNQLAYGSGANVLTSNANLTWNATSGTVVLGNLTADKVLVTDALKNVISYDLYNGTQTWTGRNTFNSNSNVILNQESLQNGATFYVSSGTVNKSLRVNELFNVGSDVTGLSGKSRLYFDGTTNTPRLNIYANYGLASDYGAIDWYSTAGVNVSEILSLFSTGQLSIPKAGGLAVTYGLTAATFTVTSGAGSTYEITSSSSATPTTFFHVAVSTSGHFITGGPKPTLSSCGTGSPSVLGDDNQGTITLGGGAPTACTITFASTWGATPTCTTDENTTGLTHYISAISATAFTVTLSATTTTIYYRCGCYGSTCR
jgi:hypothetical protein